MKREPSVQKQKNEQLSAPKPAEPKVEDQANDARSVHVAPPSSDHQQTTNKLLATNTFVSNLIEQLQANPMTSLTLPTFHNVSNNPIPAIPSPQIQNPLSDFPAFPPRSDPHNRNAERNNPFLTLLPADAPGTSNKREFCRMHSGQIRHTSPPMTEHLGGKLPGVIDMNTNPADIAARNLLLLGHAPTEQLSIFGSVKRQDCAADCHAHLQNSELWNPQHFLRHGSSSFSRVPNGSVDPSMGICTPEVHKPFFPCENHDVRSSSWWHQCGHHVSTFTTSFCTRRCRSSRDHCNVAIPGHCRCHEKPVCPTKVAKCISCDTHRWCSPHPHEDRSINCSGLSSPVISVSIAGESQPRIVELPCPFSADGQTHNGHCCGESMDFTCSHNQSTFRTCKRHLEKGICSCEYEGEGCTL